MPDVEKDMRRVNARGVGLVLAGLIFIGSAYRKGESHIVLMYGGIICAGVGLLLIVLTYWWRKPRQKEISN
jgi:hypothetical protein